MSTLRLLSIVRHDMVYVRLFRTRRSSPSPHAEPGNAQVPKATRRASERQVSSRSFLLNSGRANYRRHHEFQPAQPRGLGEETRSFGKTKLPIQTTWSRWD